MSWRPEGWEEIVSEKCPDTGSSDPDPLIAEKSFEVGADAMLEALKKGGRYGVLYDGSHSPLDQTPIRGWSIFIPEEDK